MFTFLFPTIFKAIDDSTVLLPLWVLNLTYGVLFGGDTSLVYTPSLVILDHYFERHIVKFSGIVVSGSAIFSMFMPHLLEHSLRLFGLRNTFFFLSGLVAILILASWSFVSLRPLNGPLFNVDNWRNKKYIIWILSFCCFYFGYFVPFIHIVSVHIYSYDQ